jgi:hypothetical protein
LTLAKADATMVAGKFKCEEHDVSFEAAMSKAAKP